MRKNGTAIRAITPGEHKIRGGIDGSQRRGMDRDYKQSRHDFEIVQTSKPFLMFHPDPSALL